MAPIPRMPTGSQVKSLPPTTSIHVTDSPLSAIRVRVSAHPSQNFDRSARPDLGLPPGRGFVFNAALVPQELPHHRWYHLPSVDPAYTDQSGAALQYGYTNLCSAARNEKVPWAHITMGNTYLPSIESRIILVFAVDHDLMVAVRFVSSLIPVFVLTCNGAIARTIFN